MHQVRNFFLLSLVRTCSLCELMFFFSKSANNFQENKNIVLRLQDTLFLLFWLLSLYIQFLKICIYTWLKRLGGACRYTFTWTEDFKIQNVLKGKVVRER